MNSNLHFETRQKFSVILALTYFPLKITFSWNFLGKKKNHFIIFKEKMYINLFAKHVDYRTLSMWNVR